MSKFIITEEEKSRILKMHQNATSRQYLMEDTSKTYPGSSDAAKYFAELYKNNKLTTNSSYQAPYLRFVVVETKENINNLQNEKLLVSIYGLVKRNGLWDVCTTEERILGQLNHRSEQPTIDITSQNWNSSGGYILLSKEQSDATKDFKLGQNAATFGGDAKFVSAVKSTPRYATDLATSIKDYNNAIKANPARDNQTIAKQIYSLAK